MDLKRKFDASASFVGILASGVPVILVAFGMAAINQASPFFLQKRVGKDGKEFTMIKIRSMNDKRDESGKLLLDDQRTTWAGRWLRKSHLDELPQLWNVLKGDMSLVGPRPIVAMDLEIVEDPLRQSVRPGLTGPAQISGKNSTHGKETLQIDREYALNNSFRGDLKIIAQTPAAIIRNWRLSHYNEKEQLANTR